MVEGTIAVYADALRVSARGVARVGTEARRERPRTPLRQAKRHRMGPPAAVLAPARLVAGDLPGWIETRRYFEGWYLECVDERAAHPIAFIPGVSHECGRYVASFVYELLPRGETTYLEYRSRRSLQSGSVRDRGRPQLVPLGGCGSRHRPRRGWRCAASWPSGRGGRGRKSFRQPGIMGWYRFLRHAWSATTASSHSTTKPSGHPGHRRHERRLCRRLRLRREGLGALVPEFVGVGAVQPLRRGGGLSVQSLRRPHPLDGRFVRRVHRRRSCRRGKLNRFATYTGARKSHRVLEPAGWRADDASRIAHTGSRPTWTRSTGPASGAPRSWPYGRACRRSDGRS